MTREDRQKRDEEMARKLRAVRAGAATHSGGSKKTKKIQSNLKDTDQRRHHYTAQITSYHKYCPSICKVQFSIQFSLKPFCLVQFITRSLSCSI